jgi:Ca2+-binding EF-hand superfamily protein
MSYSDQQLREAVDAVFHKYDTDNSNSLESGEVLSLINDALNHLKANRQVTQAEVTNFIKAVDVSGDGKIQKAELFEIFKKVL